MKQAVINEMTTEELVGKLSKERATLAKLNLAHAVSPIENPGLSVKQRKQLHVF